MGLVDWGTLWNNEILVTRRTRLNSGCFWDEVAARDEGRAGFPEELTDFQLSRIAVQPGETVAQLQPHTVVVASYSLFMPDMGSQLQRMLRLATNRVLLFVPGDPRMPEAVQRIIHGAKVSSQMADHVLLFNLLYEMGVDADVEVFVFHSEKRFNSRTEAVEQQMHYYDAPADKQAEMARYLDEHLREEDGACFLSRARKTAMLRWLVA